jgi:hypothetical protein
MRKHLPLIILSIVIFMIAIIDSLPTWALFILAPVGVAAAILVEPVKITRSKRTRRIPPKIDDYI